MGAMLDSRTALATPSSCLIADEPIEVYKQKNKGRKRYDINQIRQNSASSLHETDSKRSKGANRFKAIFAEHKTEVT